MAIVNKLTYDKDTVKYFFLDWDNQVIANILSLYFYASTNYQIKKKPSFWALCVN